MLPNPNPGWVWGSCHLCENLQMDVRTKNCWCQWWQEGRSQPAAVLCWLRSICLTGEQEHQPAVLCQQCCVDPGESQTWCLELAMLPWQGKGAVEESWGYSWGVALGYLAGSASCPDPSRIAPLLRFSTCCCVQHCCLWTPGSSFACTNITFLHTEVKMISWSKCEQMHFLVGS